MSTRNKRKEKAGFQPFFLAALWIIRKVGIDRLPLQKEKTEEYLRICFLGKKRPTLSEFYARRLALLLKGVFLGGLFMLIIGMYEGNRDSEGTYRELQRPSYGDGSHQTNLTLHLQKQDRLVKVPVTVQPRKRTPEQIQELFEKAAKKLEREMLGENLSFDQVRDSLCLTSQVEVEEEQIQVAWFTDPSDLMDSSGMFMREADEKGELLHLKATFRCQEEEAVYEWYATAYPKEYTGEEAWVHASQKALEEASQKEPYSATIRLPDQIDGQSVTWSREDEQPLGILLGLAAVAFLCLFLREERRMEAEVRKRRSQLLLDYPAMVLKLAMLLGAGMTIRSAFFKMAGEYQERVGQGRHHVYEEMAIACREMKSGVAEGAAYENFANRCGLSIYRKLGSILTQNLKKGSEGLAGLLEREALTAMEERKGAVRRLGEEAGTKLLFPMILMLLVVLVILLVPAWMSL